MNDELDGAPLFPVAERDRRWALVREVMAREDLAVIVTPPNSGLWDQLQAHARWLTCIGGNAASVSAVVPRDGAVTAVTSPVPGSAFWRKWQNWVDDVRGTPWAVGAGVAERLRELAIGSGQIGIVGLSGSPRFPEGLAASGFLDMVRAACPDATLVDATAWLNACRDVKSAEEVDAIGRAVRIAEAGLAVLRREARAGVEERALYGRMVGRLIELGSQPANMLMWGASPEGGHSLAPFPTARKLAPDDIVFLEIEARFRGYLGQVTQMGYVGEPPAVLVQMFDLVRDTIERMQELLTPGATLGAVVDACRAATSSSPYDVFPILHARALGEDDPIIIFNTSEPRILEWPVRENQTYAVKCQVRSRGAGPTAFWGESMRVSSTGAERLGTTPQEIMRLG